MIIKLETQINFETLLLSWKYQYKLENTTVKPLCGLETSLHTWKHDYLEFLTKYVY